VQKVHPGAVVVPETNEEETLQILHRCQNLSTVGWHLCEQDAVLVDLVVIYCLVRNNIWSSIFLY
jgi:hypothetical protein